MPPGGVEAMAGRLQGRAAFITGGGSVGPGWETGNATAVLLAREGAKVFWGDMILPAAEATKSIIDGAGGRRAIVRDVA